MSASHFCRVPDTINKQAEKATRPHGQEELKEVSVSSIMDEPNTSLQKRGSSCKVQIVKRTLHALGICKILDTLRQTPHLPLRGSDYSTHT